MIFPFQLSQHLHVEGVTWFVDPAVNIDRIYPFIVPTIADADEDPFSLSRDKGKTCYVEEITILFEIFVNESESKNAFKTATEISTMLKNCIKDADLSTLGVSQMQLQTIGDVGIDLNLPTVVKTNQIWQFTRILERDSTHNMEQPIKSIDIQNR